MPDRPARVQDLVRGTAQIHVNQLRRIQLQLHRLTDEVNTLIEQLEDEVAEGKLDRPFDPRVLAQVSFSIPGEDWVVGQVIRRTRHRYVILSRFGVFQRVRNNVTYLRTIIHYHE